MKKSNGYYMKSYLKNNWLVLLCELVIVLLLALICTVVMEGKPAWLAPAMAVTAYLLAEIRFMMAYVATIAGKAQKEDEAEDEEVPEEDLLPPEVSEPEMVEEPDYPDEAQEEYAEQNEVQEECAEVAEVQEECVGQVEVQEDCAEQVEAEQESVEPVEQELQDDAKAETEAKVELSDEPTLYLEAEPAEQAAQDADFDVSVNFTWDDEPNTADDIVISEEETELPASKTLDLDDI